MVPRPNDQRQLATISVSGERTASVPRRAVAIQSVREVSAMETALTMLAVLVVWTILQSWVLPRLGVPT
jgi:hypothetical protein